MIDTCVCFLTTHIVLKRRISLSHALRIVHNIGKLLALDCYCGANCALTFVALYENCVRQDQNTPFDGLQLAKRLRQLPLENRILYFVHADPGATSPCLELQGNVYIPCQCVCFKNAHNGEVDGRLFLLICKLDDSYLFGGF
jgi:hypothetical protein